MGNTISNITCPECSSIEDEQYFCLTCNCQGGNGGMTSIVDDNGIVWAYNGERIFCLDAEKEFEDILQNGHPCTSFVEGCDLLEKYGYITKED